MSRQSADHYKEGRLIDGYDYVNQSWVKEGRYITCGHPDTMKCDCYGRKHTGETTEPGRLDGSEPAPRGDSTPATRARNTALNNKAQARTEKEGRDLDAEREYIALFFEWYVKVKAQKPGITEKEARALYDQGLTIKEAAWNWDDIPTDVNTGPEILTGPTFSQYYTQRREQLRADLDRVTRKARDLNEQTALGRGTLLARECIAARLAELDRSARIMQY